MHLLYVNHIDFQNFTFDISRSNLKTDYCSTLEV